MPRKTHRSRTSSGKKSSVSANGSLEKKEELKKLMEKGRDLKEKIHDNNLPEIRKRYKDEYRELKKQIVELASEVKNCKPSTSRYDIARDRCEETYRRFGKKRLVELVDVLISLLDKHNIDYKEDASKILNPAKYYSDKRSRKSRKSRN